MQHELTSIDRRTLQQHLMLLVGASAATADCDFLDTKPGQAGEPSTQQMAVLIAACDIIVPQTDTAGALTVRMDNDPANSVLGKWNKVHDIPNLFMTDGAAMASSGCQNRSLTYMALSARAADAAASMLAEGAL